MSDAKKIKILEYLGTEEGKIGAKKFFDEIKEREDVEMKVNQEFFESDEFFIILDRVKEWMISNSSYTLTDDDFNYGYYFKYSTKERIELPLTENEFYSIFNAISTFGLYKYDDTIGFSNGYTNYNEWKIVWISGQGVINRLTLDINKLRDKQINKCLT